MVELNQEEQQAAAAAIMDALVDGLRIHDEQLNTKAFLAMTQVGPSVIPALEEKAREKQTRPDHRDRLLQTARYIETNGKQPGNEGRAAVNYLIDGLRVSNKKLNAKAADALCRLPPEIVDELVPVAFLNHRKIGYCVRLLGIIERIGQIPKAEDHMKLMALAGSGNAKIHEAVRRAMMNAHPQKWDVLDAWEKL